MTLLRLTGPEVTRLLPSIDLVATVREVFRAHAGQRTVLPEEAALRWVNSCGDACRSLNMPGQVELSGERFTGTKIINASLGNPERDLPRASGVVMLFDDLTARLTAIMDAGPISAGRTAAVSILAAELLWAAPVAEVGVIGAGVQAQTHLELAVRRWPRLARVSLHDAVPERARLLASRLAERHPAVSFQAVATPQAAVRGAGLVITVTTTTRGYIPAAWIGAGAVAINVSLDDLLPEVYFAADKVIVDDWSLVAADTTRLLGRLHRSGQALPPPRHRDRGPVQAGAGPGAEHPPVTVDAELADIISGSHPGRQAAHERIVVNPFGMSLHDVAVAGRLAQAARQAGAGEWLAE